MGVVGAKSPAQRSTGTLGAALTTQEATQAVGAQNKQRRAGLAEAPRSRALRPRQEVKKLGGIMTISAYRR
ncbi:hypothetical protein L917_18633 [Phytophthora nicotianae]|uniref:Uncharacterized protein n=1 Tax=Phytophthora nicotianae TaxID=4792 RepID=W2K6X3_PHYNI|nr:hypothetical protein L917_18633 [Phytophthora nicotianae]